MPKGITPTQARALELGAYRIVEDSEGWVNSFEVKSRSSTRLYTIAQRKTERWWGCSCPSWRVRRYCAHLKDLGLKWFQQPCELVPVPDAANLGKGKGFMDGYRTTDDEPPYEEVTQVSSPAKRKPRRAKPNPEPEADQPCRRFRTIEVNGG